MPHFIYRAKSRPGEIVQGTLDAESQAAAVEKLGRLGYFPLSIQRKEDESKKRGLFGRPISRRIKRRDLSLLTRQLSDLLGSGLTLLEALTALHRQMDNHRLREIVRDMGQGLRDGNALSEVLGKYPRVFPPLFIGLIRAGEVGGMLEEVLRRLADFLDKEDEIRTKVRTAMAYPLLMASVGLITIFVLLTFVIPKLVNIFLEMGQALPLPTRLLIGVSLFFTRYGWLLALVMVLFYLIVRRQHQTERGKLLFDRLRMGLPFLGDFYKKTEISRFSRTLGTLLENGIPILQSMQVVSESMGSIVLRQEMAQVYQEIAQGEKLGSSLKRSPHFPTLVVNMIAIGEESNQVERALARVADSYDRELDRSVKVMTSLLEPIMILLMGSVVAFIVISMMLPIFQIDIMAR